MTRKAGRARPGPRRAKRAAAGASGHPLRLAALINPKVLASRDAAVAKRLNEPSADRVLRRRAAEVVTRLRALFARKDAALEPVDLSEAAREVIGRLPHLAEAA